MKHLATKWMRFLTWLLVCDPRNSRDPMKYEGRDWSQS